MSRLIWPLYCAATLLVCPFALGAPAPDIPPMTAAALPALSLPDALKRALDTHPELQASQAELLAVQALQQQAGALPNPELSLLMEDLRAGQRTTTLQLAERLELGGKRQARSRVASSAVDVASAEQLAKRLALQAEVSDAFYQALAAQQRQQLNQSELELAQRLRDIASKRLAAGKVAPIEQSKAMVAEAAARLALNQAHSEQRAALQRLASLLGQRQADFGSVAGQLLPLPPLMSWPLLQQALQDAPDQQRAAHDVQRHQAEVELQRALRTPDITLSAGVKRDQLAGETMAVAGVSIPLPLFQPSQGNLREALARADKAQAEQQALYLRQYSQLQQALARFHNARDEAASLQQQVLPAAEDAQQLALRGYELGKYSLIEVLDAQRSLFQIRHQYLRALLETRRSAIEIQRISGVAPVAASDKE